jgi:hypothetical protein
MQPAARKAAALREFQIGGVIVGKPEALRELRGLR